MDLLARWRVGIYEVDSEHFDKNSSIAEGISNGSEPGIHIAEYWHYSLVSRWNNKQYNVQVEYDGTYTYDVVQVRTGEANQSAERGERKEQRESYSYEDVHTYTYMYVALKQL